MQTVLSIKQRTSFYPIVNLIINLYGKGVLVFYIVRLYKFKAFSCRFAIMLVLN